MDRADDVELVKRYLALHKHMPGDRAYQYIANYGKSRGCSVEETAALLKARFMAEE